MKKYILLLSLFCSAILWGQDVTESMAVDVGTLHAGMYLYSLIADGQLIDTKQMILTKDNTAYVKTKKLFYSCGISDVYSPAIGRRCYPL